MDRDCRFDSSEVTSTLLTYQRDRTLAQSEFLQANEAYAQLIARLRGDRDGNNLSGVGMRQAPTARQVSATEGELSAADQRSRNAREALHRAEAQLAKADPAFRSAYEVPSSAELHAMLARLQQASTAKHKNKSATDTAALLCFLELPAHCEQAPRLVGVLLSSEYAVESTDGNDYRAVYTVRFSKAVYVLHCFQKKSLSGIRTAKPDIELVHYRLKAAQQHYEETYGTTS